METEIFPESPMTGNHADEFNQLAQCVVAQIRGSLVEDVLARSGCSRIATMNLIDFVWLARRWSMLCDEQKKNVERWSLN
jgi:hypothetical protein